MKNLLNRLFGQPMPNYLPDTGESALDLLPDEGLFPDASGSDLTAVVVSDLGNVRQNNEDTGLFVRLADEGIRRVKGHLLLVADGMGGHLAGEVASQMAAEIISREYVQHTDCIEKSLARTFQIANRQIFEESRQHQRFRGMGTVFTPFCEPVLTGV